MTGLWAKELLRVARGANQGYGNTFDLQEVFFVDSEGEAALRWLGGRGATFITESAYGKDVCHRLKLNRVKGSDAKDHGRRWPESSRILRRRRTAHAGTLNSMAVADANQHPSGCRG